MPTVANGFVLKNGIADPCMGIGTWQLPNDAELVRGIHSALDLGYRHIETASIYGNEEAIGKAIRTSSVPREEIFVTSKLWTTDRGYKETLYAFSKTMRELNLDYLDLYIVHWPAAKGDPLTWQSINAGTWRAMEELYQQGRVKAIGVGNFLPHHLIPLLARAKVAPMVNQMEFHPGFWRAPALNFCIQNGIQVEGWSPLGRGTLLRHPVLQQIAENYKVSIAQLCLRWSLQHGVIPLVQSMNPEHQAENARVFDFAISAEDMLRIDRLPQVCYSGLDPDHVTF